MKRIDVRIFVGALLIAAGFLFMLQTFNIVPNAWSVLWTAAFLVGSGIFFYVYFMDRRQWWALIPAMTLLGLAGTDIALGIQRYTFGLDALYEGFLIVAVGMGLFGYAQIVANLEREHKEEEDFVIAKVNVPVLGEYQPGFQIAFRRVFPVQLACMGIVGEHFFLF